jgi:hypothetical protein
VSTVCRSSSIAKHEILVDVVQKILDLIGLISIFGLWATVFGLLVIRKFAFNAKTFLPLDIVEGRL